MRGYKVTTIVNEDKNKTEKRENRNAELIK